MLLLHETDWTGFIRSFSGAESGGRIVLLLVAGGSLALWFLGRAGLRYRRRYRHNTKKRTEVKERRLRLFQKLEGMHTPLDLMQKLCNPARTGQHLYKDYHSSEPLLPVDVLEAHQACALVRNEQLNFIADIIYDSDVAALMLDPATDKRQLLGWPMSVKDCLGVARYDCTFGMPSRGLQPCELDCLAVRALRAEGALVYLITNCAQGLLGAETENAIFGRTVHPTGGANVTAGGSSGGEAVAIACGASLAGLGTDIGGSIRIPASYCGICGFKPTSDRVTRKDMAILTDRVSPLIREAVGPMARCMDDLVAVFQALVAPWVLQEDPATPTIPFDEAQFKGAGRPLRIGCYTSLPTEDDEVLPVPAVARAVSEARKALEAAGHEVVDFSWPPMGTLATLRILELLQADGGQTVKELFRDNATTPLTGEMVRLLSLPRCLKRLLATVTQPCGNGRLSRLLRSVQGCDSVYAEWGLVASVAAYRNAALQQWREAGLDCLICPATPLVAHPHGASTQHWSADSYCVIYNILDMPAGCIPVTRVTKTDLDLLQDEYPRTSPPHCKEIVASQCNSIDLPVAVQCVALPWRDETCLRLMKTLEDALADVPIQS